MDLDPHTDPTTLTTWNPVKATSPTICDDRECPVRTIHPGEWMFVDADGRAMHVPCRELAHGRECALDHDRS